MCGRYTLVDGSKVLQAFPNLRILSDETEHFLSTPHFNIAPGQRAVVIYAPDGTPTGELMLWGFIPSWAKEKKTTYKMINARSEEVDQKPAYRHAFKRNRCLIPADGFYEWKKMETGSSKVQKVPVYIHPKGDDIWMFAGLYSVWTSPEGEMIPTYTILTTDANEYLQPIHARMPVILPREAWTTWLDPTLHDTHRLKSLLQPYPAERLASYPVSTRVNSPVNDDPSCIEPIHHG